MKQFFILLFVALTLVVGSSSTLAIPGDSDADSFSDTVEAYIGTDPFKACPGPTDFNSDGWVNLADISLMSPSYNKFAPDPAYNPRFDLNASGGVTLVDMSLTSPSYNTWCNAAAPIPDTISRNSPPAVEHLDPLGPTIPCAPNDPILYSTTCTTNNGPCTFDPDDTFWKSKPGGGNGSVSLCSYEPEQEWVVYARDLSNNPNPFDLTLSIDTLGTDSPVLTMHVEDGYGLACIESRESLDAETHLRPYNLLGGGSIVRGAKGLPETVTATITGDGTGMSVQLFTSLGGYFQPGVGPEGNKTPANCPQVEMTTNGYWSTAPGNSYPYWPQFGYRWNKSE